jgi:hypothetical protein
MPSIRWEIADDVCPVHDELLGELYRANDLFVPGFVSTLGPDIRALLALFCYRRSHLHSMGLAIAASCDEDDLVRAGGSVGAFLFTSSREVSPKAVRSSHVNRRKITLATGVLKMFAGHNEPPVDAAQAERPVAVPAL